MHDVTLLPCWGTLPGDRYHRSEWPRIPRPISCSRHSAPPAGRSEEWLTTFHLASVVLDPYTNESSWILKTAARILEGLRGSDARVNFVVTADSDDAKAFLGPLRRRVPRVLRPRPHPVRALGLSRLPAFVFIRVDGTRRCRRPKGGTPRRGAGGRDDRQRDGVAGADDPRSPPTRDRSEARRRTTERGRCSPRPPGLRQPSGHPRGARVGGGAVLVAPPGAGKTTLVPLSCSTRTWLAGRQDRDARTAAARHARGGAADGRTCSARRSARRSATRHATSAGSGATRGSRS